MVFLCISMMLLRDLKKVPMGFPRYFYDSPMGSHGIPIGFPWCFYDISMGLLWGFWRNSMGFLKDFFVVLMLFPCYLYNLSIRFLWDSHWVSMIFRWDYSGISNEQVESISKSMESTLQSIEKNGKCMKINWNQIEIQLT